MLQTIWRNRAYFRNKSNFLIIALISLSLFSCTDKKDAQQTKAGKPNFWVGDTTSNIHGLMFHIIKKQLTGTV